LGHPVRKTKNTRIKKQNTLWTLDMDRYLVECPIKRLLIVKRWWTSTCRRPLTESSKTHLYQSVHNNIRILKVDVVPQGKRKSSIWLMVWKIAVGNVKVMKEVLIGCRCLYNLHGGVEIYGAAGLKAGW